MAAQVKDMTVGSPARHILLFALPLMLGNVLQQCYTMIDSIVIGQFVGMKAFAAVGAADCLNWIVMGTVIGFCQGLSIQISQAFGAEDYPALRKATAMSLLLSALAALACTVVFVPATPAILRLLHTPAGILPDSARFLQVMFGGTIVIAGYNVFSAILRAVGNSRTPLVAMSAAASVNILLDLLFVVGFRWGVTGAAVATVLAQLFACLFCLAAVRRIPALRLTRGDWAPDAAVIRHLLALGTPMAFQNAIIGLGSMVVQSVINGFGVIFVTGYAAVMKLYGLLELAATSFGFAMASFTGQNLGAGKYDRIRIGLNAALKLSIAIAAAISAVILLLGRQIARLFISGNPGDVRAAVDVTYHYLFIMGIFLFILYMLYIYRSALQGMGDTVVPMISGIVELGMRVACVLLLPIVCGRSGVYFAEVIAWLGATVLLMGTYYYRIRRLFSRKSAGREKIERAACEE